MSAKRIEPTLSAVEAALASLNPTSSSVDRDRLMFLAGRASARRSPGRWMWPAATAVVTVWSLVLTEMTLRQPPEPSSRQIAEVEQSPPAVTAPGVELHTDDEPIGADYLVLRDRVLREGVDALPPLSVGVAPARPILRAGAGRGGAIEGLFDG